MTYTPYIVMGTGTTSNEANSTSSGLQEGSFVTGDTTGDALTPVGIATMAAVALAEVQRRKAKKLKK